MKRFHRYRHIVFFAAVLMWAAAVLPAAAEEEGGYFLKKGNEYYRAGKWDQAIEQYQQALKINPVHLGARHNLGLAYQSKKDFARAIEAFNKLKEVDRLFVPAYINLGLVYTQKGCYKEAQREYQEAISIEPNNLVAYLNLTAVFAKQKDYARAFRIARRGLAIEPASPHIHLLMANMYYLMKKYAPAKREYLKVLKIQSDVLPARMALALSLAHLGEYDRALSQMQIVKNLDPVLPDIPWVTGQIYALRFRAEKKNWKEAVEQLKLAASGNPDDIEICREFADILAANSQYTQARKYYRRILDNPKVSVEDRKEIESILQSWPKDEVKGKTPATKLPAAAKPESNPRQK